VASAPGGREVAWPPIFLKKKAIRKIPELFRRKGIQDVDGLDERADMAASMAKAMA